MSTILQLLEQHNKPFSLNEIQQNLNQSKTSIQKSLTTLIESEKVIEKTYGKQKVYFLNQNQQENQNLKENLLEMDRKISELDVELKEIQSNLKNKETEFRQNEGKMSLSEALDVKIKLERDLEAVKKELEKYEDMEVVPEDVKKKVQKDYERFLKEYRKRKRMCMDMLNNILENYPKSKKQLFEDIGIETDEDVNFSL